MKTTILLSIPVIALLCGCQSGPPKPTAAERFDAVMRTWIGSSSSDLVAKMGPPQNIMQDKNGEIWTYFERRESTTAGHSYTTSTGSAQTYGRYRSGSLFSPPGYSGNTTGQGQSVTTYMPPQTRGYDCRRTFFVNKEGNIYRYSWKGL